MTEGVMQHLSAVRAVAGDTEDMAAVETFVAIGLQLIAQSNVSKVREVMRIVEIAARMDGKHVFE